MVPQDDAEMPDGGRTEGSAGDGSVGDGSIAAVDAGHVEAAPADAMDAALAADTAKAADASSMDGAPTDSASMADAGDAGVDAAPTCANGPYVTNTVTVREVSTGLPLPGATVKANICGISQTTDAAGMAVLRLPTGMESWIRLDAPGEIPTMFPVRTLTYDQAESHVILNDQYRQGYFPDYDANYAEIFIDVAAAGDATPPCNAYDGVTIAVLGHPEAVVTYWMGGFPNMPAVGAIATTAPGVATITGIAAGVQVLLDLKKTGCTVALEYPSSAANPKIPLEKGAVTYVVPGLRN